MRVLLDECVDWRLLRDLAGHDVKTARQMGWSEVMNGSCDRIGRTDQPLGGLAGIVAATAACD